MPPVHAYVVNRTIATMRRQIGECRGQERNELVARHLARGHRKLPMPDLAQPAHVASDRDVIGRIGEDHFGLLALHQGGNHGGVECIATEEPVGAELPNIALLTAGRNLIAIGKQVIRRIP
jgi:hypothetical protein